MAGGVLHEIDYSGRRKKQGAELAGFAGKRRQFARNFILIERCQTFYL
jgi:hypothetical protein